MEMGLKNVLDGGTIFLGFFYVGLHFPKRVYDCGFSFTFYIIGALCKASCVNLFNFHFLWFLPKINLPPVLFSHQSYKLFVLDCNVIFFCMTLRSFFSEHESTASKVWTKRFSSPRMSTMPLLYRISLVGPMAAAIKNWM